MRRRKLECEVRQQGLQPANGRVLAHLFCARRQQHAFLKPACLRFMRAPYIRYIIASYSPPCLLSRRRRSYAVSEEVTSWRDTLYGNDIINHHSPTIRVHTTLLYSTTSAACRLASKMMKSQLRSVLYLYLPLLRYLLHSYRMYIYFIRPPFPSLFRL